jgi:hypothetical protein
MFGMEKKKALFEFDLEVELKKDPQKKIALLQEAEKKIQELKTCLREGAHPEHFDAYGLLLQGFAAFSKVLNKIPTKSQGGRHG